MKVEYFYSTIEYNPVSWSIRSATKGDYSHTGQKYTASPLELVRTPVLMSPDDLKRLHKDDDGLIRFYMESIATKDKITGKTGVRGPYPWSKLEEWEAKNKRRKVITQPLPLTSKQSAIMCHNALEAIWLIEYAHVQIMRNWSGYRLGRGVPLRRRSRLKWTCVEFNVRMLSAVDAAMAVEALDLGDILYDEYCPSGKRGPGLYEKIEELNRKHATKE